METFVSYFAPIFGGSLYLFMVVCGLYKGPGIFNNYYSKSCYRARQRSVLWPILACVMQVLAAGVFAAMALDYIVVSTGLVILGGVFIALGWCAAGGFDFTILPEDEV